MRVHQLLDLPKLKYNKGFKLLKGRVVWSDVHVDGDRKRIRISRNDGGYVKQQYVKPGTEVEIVS